MLDRKIIVDMLCYEGLRAGTVLEMVGVSFSDAWALVSDDRDIRVNTIEFHETLNAELALLLSAMGSDEGSQ